MDAYHTIARNTDTETLLQKTISTIDYQDIVFFKQKELNEEIKMAVKEEYKKMTEVPEDTPAKHTGEKELF